jgi:hypothetical protein
MSRKVPWAVITPFPLLSSHVDGNWVQHFCQQKNSKIFSPGSIFCITGFFQDALGLEPLKGMVSQVFGPLSQNYRLFFTFT